jgi:IS30 family transposase
MNGVPIKYKIASEVKDYRWLARPRSTVLYGRQSSSGFLYKHLRHRKPYKKRTGSPEARGQIIGRISTDEGPAVVDAKVRLGDWEVDTVIGKNHQGVLVTLAEHVSKRR